MYHILNAKGPAATPKEIASHYNVIMMAGAVTTATFLSGVLYYLCHNRQALRKLQDEVRSTFSRVEAIRSKDLMKLTYLNAVVEEGLRIYPPAGAAHLSRIVPVGGCEISGSFIPEGVSVPSFPFHLRPCFLLFHRCLSSFTFSSSLCATIKTFHLPPPPADSCICPPLVYPSRPRQLPRT